MEKFRGVDYYGIEDLLSEEERMVRDAVRDWVETEFLPVVTEHHRAGTFPLELIPKLGELGVFGATLKGYGCAGLNHVAYGLSMQELERGDSGLRSAASVQSGLDRKSTRLNSSHSQISYAVFCLKKKNNPTRA